MLLSAREVSYTTLGDTGPLGVLDGLALDLEAGEVLDISGPSGAGKTTLLRALGRLLPGAYAHLELNGAPARSFSPQEWRVGVALLPQTAVMRPGSVQQNILLPWSLKVRHDVASPTASELRSALDKVGLSDVSLDRDAARLSVGQRARVALLRVILTRPAVLLLDEPDASLDDASADQVAAMTRAFAEAGGGVIRVRHQRIDSVPARRMRLANGRLEAVITDGC